MTNPSLKETEITIFFGVGHEGLAFNPPLKPDKLKGMPMPKDKQGREIEPKRSSFSSYGNKIIALESDALQPEDLVMYAEEVALHIGDCAVRPDFEYLDQEAA
jgi:hypothetical protein